jgi:steroid 5-alpha reductase family enzyme
MTGALWLSFACTLAAFLGLWVVSLLKRDTSVVDFYWGPGFAVIGWTSWAFHTGKGTELSGWGYVVLSAVTLWGLRLGWHILRRHVGVEDARYAAMRARHGRRWPLKSLYMVFGLQALIQWVAASAVLVAVLASPRPVLPLIWLGLLVFCAGFLLEALSDQAVSRFKSDAANKGRLLTTGLHGVVRYPSYLGEIILQCGLALMAFGLTLNPLAFVGAVLMTILIIKVSGVPLLEEQFRSRPDYADWIARTGALWPKL